MGISHLLNSGSNGEKSKGSMHTKKIKSKKVVRKIPLANRSNHPWHSHHSHLKACTTCQLDQQYLYEIVIIWCVTNTQSNQSHLIETKSKIPASTRRTCACFDKTSIVAIETSRVQKLHSILHSPGEKCNSIFVSKFRYRKKILPFRKKIFKDAIASRK